MSKEDESEKKRRREYLKWRRGGWEPSSEQQAELDRLEEEYIAEFKKSIPRGCELVGFNEEPGEEMIKNPLLTEDGKFNEEESKKSKYKKERIHFTVYHQVPWFPKIKVVEVPMDDTWFGEVDGEEPPSWFLSLSEYGPDYSKRWKEMEKGEKMHVKMMYQNEKVKRGESVTTE